MDLSDRKRRILRAVVEQYIVTAEPVGSKLIAALAGLDVSSATIRNEMADLTEQGFLEQPHTSAGRVPSVQGYRLYVSELMEEYKLSLQETQRINEALHLKMAELDRVISEAGRVAAQLTKLPSFAFPPRSAQAYIRRFDLLLVDDHSFIAVVMTDGSLVRNKLISISSQLSDSQLQLLGALLNTSFVGCPLAELGARLSHMAAHTAGDSFGLISLVVSFAMEVLEEQAGHAVYTAGVSHLLEHPEYQDLGKAQRLLHYLSDESELAHLPFAATEDCSPRILVGPADVADELRETSVVLASYDIGDGLRGVIGVVGPTRMDYAKVTARLAYFAQGLGRIFGRQILPPEGGSDQ